MNAPQTGRDDYLGVRSLAAITIVVCFLSGVARLLAALVSSGIAAWWCHVVAVCGMFVCLFLAGMVAVAFFREGRRHRFALGLGVGFGFAPFVIWYFYVCIL